MRVMLLILFVAAISFLVGCRIYSMVAFENREFPSDVRPSTISSAIAEKYSVGDVIIQPRIIHADPAQTSYKLAILFFSKTTNETVSISSVSIFIDGNKLEYGEGLIGQVPSPWKMYSANHPFFASSVSGEPMVFPPKNGNVSRIDMKITVLIKQGGNNATAKIIDASFVPKKKSFIE
ncbi:MAG: hypothetical protein M5U15_03775 [Kiritimatiellae bacterium]|nr:hypothetical protein [Kiritimatiellia bacterium]